MSSTLCIPLGHPFGWERGTDGAASDVGIRVVDDLSDTLEDLRETETLGGALRSGLDALNEVVDECSVEDWDGYGAAAVDELSVACAAEVLQALPSGIPAADVSVDPTGQVVLEWLKDERALSIIIGRTGVLTFAFLSPSRKLTGVEDLLDDIPDGLATAFAALVGKRS